MVSRDRSVSVEHTIAALLLTLWGQGALAFIIPPIVVPQHPVAGKEVGVKVGAGQCDLFLFDPPPQVTRTENSIHLIVHIDHHDDPILCVGDPNIIDYLTYSIGTFAPGSYTVQVDRWYYDFFMDVHNETIGIIPFSVADGLQPDSVPSLSFAGQIALAIALLATFIVERLPRRSL